MPSEIFNYTGGWQTWTVPTGVFNLNVALEGAGAGTSSGGRVAGTLSVNEGQVLWIMVGREGRPRQNRQGGDFVFGGGGPGGNGTGSGDGGDGGGGASAIRLGSAEGTIVAVAGGAGGRSGDSGGGGRGGAEEGEQGFRGSGGSGPNSGTTNPTGGTQGGPGAGGRSDGRPGLAGEAGTDRNLGRGGKGGQGDGNHTHGGGGGGGGYFPGGGGQAGRLNVAPGGGGAGGSNYSARLGQPRNSRGGGSSTNGAVSIEWINPPPPFNAPPRPTDVTVNGIEFGSDISTLALSTVQFQMVIDDQDNRLWSSVLLRVSPEWDFPSYATYFSTPRPAGVVHTIDVVGLEPATKYYVQMWSVNAMGMYSPDPPAVGSFWTNRPPLPPDLLTPGENTLWSPLDNIVFTWRVNEEDERETQSGFHMRWRAAALPGKQSVAWNEVEQRAYQGQAWTIDAGTFKGNTTYEWMLRTFDSVGNASDWSVPNSFYIVDITRPPEIVWPRRGEAVNADTPNLFKWIFRDPRSEAVQSNADLRYRVVGTSEWITNYGDVHPGAATEWFFPASTFIEGYQYEWAVRTYNDIPSASDWTDPETFWAIPTPGSANVEVTVGPSQSQPALGCGVNRVYIYDRGGQVMRGEITSIARLRYHRQRDDISSCSVFTTGKDCSGLLGDLRTWQHELVVFRDGIRVWEGPVTRIDAKADEIEVEAKDVMAYVYRRVMRQGYSDAWRKVNGVEYGGLSVVVRAGLIVRNCLAYDDPNVLRYLTQINHNDDARQHRSVPDYAKTAWEEIDNLAATGGLDYTTVGRRIVLWDTHRAIGRLPEMRDGDFSEPIHVTEYGMQLANHFAVTNNDGVFGVAERGVVDGVPQHYGWIEQLASAYGETESDEPEVLTPAARANLEIILADQADRNIASRWPAPLVVRVPDNATLNPDLNIGFNQLVPGVWIPVRARGTIREVSQWQKLDSVTVAQEEDGEKITVVMSAAPNGGNDPDSDNSGGED